MKAIALVLMSLSAAACVTTDGVTPGQAYFAADRAYEQALETAVAYKDQCIQTPADLQGNCRDVVNILRRVNREAQEIRELADMAMVGDDESLLREATDHLEELRDRLRRELELQMLLKGQPTNPVQY